MFKAQNAPRTRIVITNYGNENRKRTKEIIMKTIKFSSDYPKLHGQKTATLVAVARIKIDENTPPELLEYDTKKADGSYFNLEHGTYLQLIFLGDKSIPFCTIRSAQPAHKVEDYKSSIGQKYNIEIIENNVVKLPTEEGK
jgi:hypothetical protein